MIWGTGDVVTPRAQADRAATALGGAPIIEIADSGHAVHVETPEAFAAALSDALAAAGAMREETIQ